MQNKSHKKNMYKEEKAPCMRRPDCKWAWHKRLFFKHCIWKADWLEESESCSAVFWFAPAGQTTTCQIIKILVLLPHVSRSTVIIHFKTDHLNQPGNVIKPPPTHLLGLRMVSQWWCKRTRGEIRTGITGENHRDKDGEREWLRMETGKRKETEESTKPQRRKRGEKKTGYEALKL